MGGRNGDPGMGAAAPLTLAEREARLARRGARVSTRSAPADAGVESVCTVLLPDGRVLTGRGPTADAARTEALAQAEDALGLLGDPAPPPGPPAATRLLRAAPWTAVCLVALVGAFFAHRHIPPAPGPGPDLDCADIGHQVRVGDSDPHGLDRDRDGIGCEAEGRPLSLLALALVGVAGLAGAGGVRAYIRAG